MELKKREVLIEVNTSNQDENTKHSELDHEKERHIGKNHKEKRGDIKEERREKRDKFRRRKRGCGESIKDFIALGFRASVSVFVSSRPHKPRLQNRCQKPMHKCIKPMVANA